MAAAHVQQHFEGVLANTLNPTITLPASVASGDTLVLCFEGAFHNPGGVQITAVSDDSGLSYTWQQDATAASGNNAGNGIWSCACASGMPSGTTITITVSGATAQNRASLDEFSGLLASAYADQSVSVGGTTTATAAVGPTGSTAQADELAVANFSFNATYTEGTDWAPPAGWTLLSAVAGTKSLGACYQVLSSVGTVTCTLDEIGGSHGAWSGTLVTYKAAAGGGSPQTQDAGAAASTPAALGADLTPGAATLLAGDSASTPVALGADLSAGAVTLDAGEAAGTASAYGADLSIGAVTLLAGTASSSGAAALGADLAPATVVLLAGFATSTPAALGADVATGGASQSIQAGAVTRSAQAEGAGIAATGATAQTAGEAAGNRAAHGANPAGTGAAVILAGTATRSSTARGVTVRGVSASLLAGRASSAPAASGADLTAGGASTLPAGTANQTPLAPGAGITGSGNVVILAGTAVSTPTVLGPARLLPPVGPGGAVILPGTALSAKLAETDAQPALAASTVGAGAGSTRTGVEVGPSEYIPRQAG